MAAASSVAVLRAFNAADWGQVTWLLVDAEGVPLEQAAFIATLEGFVGKTVDMMLGVFEKVKEDGKYLYQWKYRDVTGCRSIRTLTKVRLAPGAPTTTTQGDFIPPTTLPEP